MTIVIHTSILFVALQATTVDSLVRWSGEGRQRLWLWLCMTGNSHIQHLLCVRKHPSQPQKPYLSLVCIFLLMGSKTLTDPDSVKISTLEENGICYISLRSCTKSNKYFTLTSRIPSKIHANIYPERVHKNTHKTIFPQNRKWHLQEPL